MTSVIGILSKRGVAIAADSAVTRNRYDDEHMFRTEKVTKNGNKTIRLSNTQPVGVMTVGNASFLDTPWENILRRYRQTRGDLELSTVKDYVYDLFDYISKHDEFWNLEEERRLMEDKLDEIFIEATERGQNLTSILGESNATFSPPKISVAACIRNLKKIQKYRFKYDKACQFANYDIESFRKYAKETIDSFLYERLPEKYTFAKTYDKAFLDGIREELEVTLLASNSTQVAFDTELIFTGFGKDEMYPSLIPVRVYYGIDHRVNYIIDTGREVHINDNKPVAICPFGQIDVIDAILTGVHSNWSYNVSEKIEDSLIDMSEDDVYDDSTGGIGSTRLLRFLEEGRPMTLPGFIKQCRANRHRWEKRLANYDLRTMAAFANSMIELTGFQRILTFQQEGVGGETDVAVITKTDGFSWLNRKSWYHRKDVNGSYGSLGI